MPEEYEWISKNEKYQLLPNHEVEEMRQTLMPIATVSDLLSNHNSWAYPMNIIRESELNNILLRSIVRKHLCKVCLNIIQRKDVRVECKGKMCCECIHSQCLRESAWHKGFCGSCRKI